MSEATPTADASPLQWWWSRDDERFHGPAHSKAAAIMEAWADDPDQGTFICQAACGTWRTAILAGDDLAERFDEANEDSADPDGDPPSDGVADWEKLATRLYHIVRNAIREKGLTSWAFVDRRPSEWVEIPKMWAAAEAASRQEA